MKSHKLSAAVLLIILFSSCIYSQTGWVQFNPGFSQSYNSVHFIDAQTGLACGQSGAVIRTTNGGLNWVNINSSTTYTLNDIKFLSPTIAVAAGEYDIFIRSTNAGLNWLVVNQPTTTNYSIRIINNFSSGNAVANSNTYISPYEYTYLYKTTNYGANWQKVEIYVPNRWIHFIDMNTGWTYGSYFTGPPFNQYYLRVYKTVNGGNNWSVIDEGPGVSINPGMIYFYDANYGYRYSHMGVVNLARTVNGGSSWLGIDVNSLYRLIRSFCFVNQFTGWFVGDNSLIFTTSNSGSNWTEQQSPISNNFKTVYFYNALTGWIAAGASGILKTTTGGVYTSVKQISNQIPEKFELSQNYPNPFNPSTTIKFDISKNSFVKIAVYDLQGREVGQLLNEERKPGSYEIQWDGGRYSSGVYFYKIITDEFVVTKKMILIK